MPAYFSSTIKKPIYAAFSVVLLVLCLLVTHWVGLSHGISHANKQAIEANVSSKLDKSFNHGAEVCHVYDALSLAGFIPSSHLNSLVVFLSFCSQLGAEQPFYAGLINSAYQSRAPPIFIL